MLVSEIRVKQILVNQGLGVFWYHIERSSLQIYTILKPSSCNHSKPHTMPHMRLLKRFVLFTLCYETKLWKASYVGWIIHLVLAWITIRRVIVVMVLGRGQMNLVFQDTIMVYCRTLSIEFSQVQNMSYDILLKTKPRRTLLI